MENIALIFLLIIMFPLSITSMHLMYQEGRDNISVIKISRSAESILLENHVTDFKKAFHLYIIVNDQLHRKLSNLIVNSYSSRIPSIVLNQESEIPPHYKIYSNKINQMVGIYDHSQRINVVDWIRIFGQWWNPRSRIVIWILEKVSKVEVEKLFEDLWKHKSLNVVIFALDETANIFNSFSYNPFRMKSNTERGVMNKLSLEEKYFRDKLNNLYGYSIIISMFNRPPFCNLNNSQLVSGSEVQIVKTFCSILNCTIKVNTDEAGADDYVVSLNESSIVGPIGDILTNRSEFLGNAYHIDNIFDKKLEHSFPHSASYYVMIVPIGSKEKPLDTLMRHLYSNPTIPLIHLNLCIIAMYLLYRKEKNIFFKSWKLILQQQFDEIGTDYLDRLLKIMWILFAMIMSCAYQEYTYRSITHPVKIFNIDTLQELCYSGLILKVEDHIISWLNNSDDDVLRCLGRKAEQQLKFRDCIDELVSTKKVACGTENNFLSLELHDLIFGENPKAHIMKEKFGQSWYVRIVENGFPFIEKFNRVEAHLRESGIIKHWSELDLIRGSYRHPKKLNKLRFKVIVVTLILGLFHATSVFIGELISYYTKFGRKIGQYLKNMKKRGVSFVNNFLKH